MISLHVTILLFSPYKSPSLPEMTSRQLIKNTLKPASYFNSWNSIICAVRISWKTNEKHILQVKPDLTPDLDFVP